MNGKTLQWAFSVIVWTFCFILVGSTILALMGKITPDLYEKIIDKLGIITLFSMIAQSYLHSKDDHNKDGIPDIHQIINEEKEKKDEKTNSNNPVK